MAIPMRFAGRCFPGDMTVAGSCSAAISAACHVKISARERRSKDGGVDDKSVQWGYNGQYRKGETVDDEHDHLIAYPAEVSGHTYKDDHEMKMGFERVEIYESEYLMQLARKPLRWGVVSEAYEEEFQAKVGHLSFESADVGQPNIKDYYMGQLKY
jgi:hypothetical protein